MAKEWLSIFFKFSGFVFTLKQKMIKTDNVLKAIPYAIVLFVIEFVFAVISLPIYLFVPPKLLQETGFVFPSQYKEMEISQTYIVRRKISLATAASAGGVFLLKVFFVGIVSFYLLRGDVLLAVTQSWTFTTAGDYTYDTAKIEVTGGVSRLKNTGSTSSGNTTNSGFDSAATGWTYADWGQDGGESNVAGTYVSSGGSPGGYLQVSFPAGANDEFGGYYYQAFTTSVANPTVTLDFSKKVSAHDTTPQPVTFKFYVFVDTSSAAPTIGTEVYSSAEITSTQGFSTSTDLDVSSKVTATGTYYVKVAVWLETAATGGPYTIGYDNVLLDWTKTTVTYASDSPTIQPTTSLNPATVSSWDTFSETSTLNGGSINYQLSDDDGTTWKFWNGSAWATVAGATDYNSASVINTNIPTFSTTNKKMMWKAFLVGNGSQQVTLDNIDITYTENDLPDVLNLTPAQRTSQAGLVDITYNLQDNESDSSSLVTYEYSLTGAFAGEQATMTAATGDAAHNGVTGLTTSAGGVAHTFVWNTLADLGAIYDGTVYVRLRANDGAGNGSYATSASFAVDLVNSVVSNVTASQTAGSTNVSVTYDVSDDTSTDLVVELNVSQDSGATWTVATTTSSGNVGSGQITGTSKTITWAAGTDFDEQAQSDIRVQVRARDKFQNQGSFVASTDFTLDTVNPATNVSSDLQAQPNAGDTTVTIGGSFTETNPNTNNFYLALNGGAYGSATAGTSDTATPSNQATAAGATLDGNDYISQVKITHADDFGQTRDNENSSPAASFKYVKPYTPQAPTLSNPITTQLDLVINPHASETSGLEYAIFETSQSKYVQANGTLGASAVWQTTAVWGTVTVTGLSSPVANYIFEVKSRNTSDTAHAASSESAFSSTSQITNTAPSISLGSIEQTTDGTQYVTVIYTGTDGQGDLNNMTVYEYSQDNSAWSTATEKTGVNSDGTTALTFLTGGTTHDFMWNSGTDLATVEDDTVYFRLRSTDTLANSTLQTSSAFAVDNKIPVVSNVVATQNAGARTVAITYDLTDNNNSTVEIDISQDGGSTWTVTDTTVSGHVGSAVTPGIGKTISWNAGTDFDNQYQTDMQVRVRALDTRGNQGSNVSSANFTVDTNDPTVSNVTAVQDSGVDTFTFNYDVSEDAGNVTVALEVSSNGGSTWVVPITSAAGSVGSGISSGTGKTITWNGATDYNDSEEQDMRIRITATDGFTNAGNASSANFNLDTLAPRVTSVSASQVSGSTNVTITYNLADQNTSLVEVDISQDSGSTWTVTDTSVTGDVGSGITAGTGKSITWAAGTDFDQQAQSDLRVRVRAKDTYNHQGANVQSADFTLDTLNPTTNVAADLQSQPSAGATTALIGGSFTEANPNTNEFYLAINGGAYGSATAGTTNNASPSNQATAVGATLDGNDYISKVKITHTDDFGQTVDNENTLPATTLKYVKPYTPQAPTIDNPTVGAVDVLINAHASETSGLEYAIYESSQNKYVQGDGTLGVSAVWRTPGTGAGQWGVTSGVSGKINVNGLVNNSFTYSFAVKSRNTSDTSHASTSESDLSSGASSVNQAPTITLGSIAQTTDGTQYVTINYTGTDLESESSNIITTQYSLDNSVWSTMTEKSGVGSDGTTALAFVSGGTAHDFMWDVGTDLPGTNDDSVYIRLRANDGTSSGALATSNAFTVDILAPSIDSLTAAQNSAGNVIVSYTLDDVGNSTVEMDISEDGGSTWTVTDTSVTGHIGTGVSAGSGKSITWAAKTDFNNQVQSDLRVRVRALDSYSNQGSYAQSANFSIDTVNPVVSNVSASQNSGLNTVNITYDLSDTNNSTIEIDVSQDGGATWTVTDTSVTGNVGSGVTSGTGKTITWDAGADFSGQSQSDMRVRVRATDAYANASGNVESANFSLDSLAPTITSVVGAQVSGSTNVTITYSLSDLGAVNIALDISDDGGSTWTVTDTSVTGDVGAGLTTGSKTVTWAAGTDFNEQQQSDMRVRVRGTDTFNNTSSNVESADFSLDTLNPTTNVTADLSSQPNAGNTTATIGGSFTEANPNTNEFSIAINDGVYGSATTGTGNTASPSNQATAVGATLDGNDFISKVKITHTDDFGQAVTNENTSPTTAYKYVKPYTPQAPSVANPQNTSVDVSVNPNASEVVGLSYAIYESSQDKYVQLNGTLGASAVWRTSVAWATTTVSGLTSPVAQYSFQVKSRNSSDTLNASTSESSLSSAGAISNTAPSIVLGSIAQETGGVNYVTINYTGTDTQNDTVSLNSFEYSRDNSAWSTMTEKSGVGSSGTSGLAFTSAGASFTFKWDSATDLSGIEDSTVYIRLRGTDSITAGSLTASSAFAIDNSGPSVSNVTVSQAASSYNMTFQYDLTDNTGSNINVVLDISNDGGSTWTVTDTSVTGDVGASVSAGTTKSIVWAAGTDFTNQEESDMVVRIRGTDSYGNAGSFTSSSNFAVDTNGPTVASVSASQTTNTNNVVITYSLTDQTPAGHNVEIGISENGGSTWTVTSTSVTGDVGTGVATGASKSITWNAGTDYDNQEQSDFRVRVRATDYFGGVGTYAQSADFALDTKAPVVSNITAAQATGSTSVLFNYDLTDGNSSNINMEMDISSDNGSSWTVTDTSVTGAVGTGVTAGTAKAISWSAGADFSGQEQTDMRVRFRGTDSFGNLSDNYVIVSGFEVDTAAPSGLSSLSKFTGTNSQITLNWSSGVSDANFNHYEIWHGTNLSDVNNRATSTVEWDNTDDTALATVTTTFTVVTGLSLSGVSNYYMKIWGIDDSGNEITLAAINVITPVAPVETVTTPVATGGAAPSEVVFPDTTPPGKPILNSIQSPINTTSITITGLAEPRSIVTLYDNNVTVATLGSLADNGGVFSQQFIFAEGNHRFAVSARDAVGNGSVLSDTINLTIDVTGPISPIILTPQNGENLVDVRPLLVGKAEPGSAIDLTVNNTQYESQADIDGNWIFFIPTESIRETNNIVVTRSIDEAGNVSNDTQITFNAANVPVIDTGIGGIIGGILVPTIPGAIVVPQVPPAAGPAVVVIPPSLIQPRIIEAIEIPSLPIPKVDGVAPIVQDNTFSFSGTALPNSTVLVYINSEKTLLYSTRSDKFGRWNVNHSQDVVSLQPGEHSIFAVSVDEKSRVKTQPSVVSTFMVTKNIWVSLFNYLNLQTTIAALIVLLLAIWYLYRNRLRTVTS